MSELGRALLADVCEHPDDDARRLVYADWLDDDGQGVRAEAIRLGVRRRGMDDLDPEAWALDARRTQLVEPHWDGWRKALPKFDKVSWHGLREGLADSVSFLEIHPLTEHQDALFAAGPITHLEAFVSRGSDAAAQMAACRYAGRLRKLELHGVAPPEAYGLETLASSPGLAGVRSLDLGENAHDNRILESLARCPAWPSLERLNLYRGIYDAAGMRTLAGAALLGSLRSLKLSRSTIGGAGLRELLRSPHLTGVRARRITSDAAW